MRLFTVSPVFGGPWNVPRTLYRSAPIVSPGAGLVIVRLRAPGGDVLGTDLFGMFEARLALQADRIREGHAEASVDQRLVGAHGVGMAGHHVVCQRAARRKQLGRLDHSIHETPLRRELGAQE